MSNQVNATLAGQLVEMVAEDYDMADSRDPDKRITGTSFTAFVQSGPKRFGPARVRLSEPQFWALAERSTTPELVGSSVRPLTLPMAEEVSWPVIVSVSYGKLKCQVLPEFAMPRGSAGARRAPAAAVPA